MLFALQAGYSLLKKELEFQNFFTIIKQIILPVSHRLFVDKMTNGCLDTTRHG